MYIERENEGERVREGRGRGGKNSRAKAVCVCVCDLLGQWWLLVRTVPTGVHWPPPPFTVEREHLGS